MRVLIHHRFFNNGNYKEKHKLENIFLNLKKQVNLYIDNYSDFDTFQAALQTRSYSIIICDKNYLKVNTKYIDFFSTIIIIEENLTKLEKKDLYYKKVNNIIETDNISKEEIEDIFFNIKTIQLSTIKQLYNLKIDLNKKTVEINKEEEKNIRGKMFDIFIFLLFNLEITFSKEEIINAVFEDPITVNENSIDTYLSTLKKIVNAKTNKFKMNVINKEGYNICLNNIKKN